LGSFNIYQIKIKTAKAGHQVVSETSTSGFDLLALFDLMQRVLANNDIVEIHHNLLRFTKKERRAVLEMTRKMVCDKKA
jgi:hypothetical protein